MWDFNRMLLSTPLDVKRAMHAEGGPEASLSIHAGGIDLDLSGSFETGFNENNANLRQWAIPNVLGVSAPPPGTPAAGDSEKTAAERDTGAEPASGQEQ